MSLELTAPTGSQTPQSKGSVSGGETLQGATVDILKHTEEDITVIKVSGQEI